MSSFDGLNNCQLNIGALPAMAVLETQWRALEAEADASFFNSWSWIGNWLTQLPASIKPQLVRASAGGKTLALCILVERKIVRHRFMPVRQTSMNSTGNPHLDALMIEYNDVLFDRSCGPDIRGAVLRALLDKESIEEFRVDGVRIDANWTALEVAGFRSTMLERVARGVDLDDVRAGGGEYLPLISANSRSKIRKAFKDTAKMGEMRLDVAQDAQQAEAMFVAMCNLHTQAWSERGESGAFANEFLLEFHRQLIRKQHAHGEIQIIAVRAGDALIGVLYNFVHRGRVYSYQSGFDFTLGPKQYKPGLLAHTLAIEHNARLGHRYYDFMAGDSQYKRSMGTRSDTLQWVVFQRQSLKFRIENSLRALKQRLKKPQSVAAPAEDQA